MKLLIGQAVSFDRTAGFNRSRPDELKSCIMVKKSDSLPENEAAAVIAAEMDSFVGNTPAVEGVCDRDTCRILVLALKL